MTPPHTSHLTLILSTALSILLLLTGYFVYRTTDLNNTVASLLGEKQEVIVENNATTQTLLEATDTISQLEKELAFLEEDYQEEKNKNDQFQDQIDAITGTVGDLDKLSKTDQELLQKYSKVSFLNENYIPAKLRKIDDEYVLEGKKEQYFHGEAMRLLERMLDAAERDDIDLKIISAYRSFDEQNQLKGQFTEIFGEGANAFSADQGFSEHQLGTTIDITTPAVGGTFNSFGETEAFTWLGENAHNYGFILSYHEDNTFYIYEPWHWRFVGRDLARDLERNDDMTFYTMEQREINEYLLEIFD
jgi:D-alanyl-D-alanine carboxypeptidase